MIKHLLFLLKYYVALLLVFLAGKMIFLLYNGAGQLLGVSDFFEVMQHGVPLDIATAGYLTALPWLLALISQWVEWKGFRQVYVVYVGIVSFLLSLIFVADTCLYEFWGFKLDGTVFAYLDSPKGVMASVSIGYVLLVTMVFLVVSLLLFFGLWKTANLPIGKSRRPWFSQLAFLLVGGLLFLGIRGGVGKSTANVGMVYYSDKAFLNHAAVNPAFSIMASLFKNKDFSAMHDYFPETDRARIFASLSYNTQSELSDTLLSVSRPNVLLILMEGCGASFVEAFGGESGVTPHLNRLAREGVSFTRCYANSFRTDRGTICALSGYPSFPDVSVMKLAGKASQLPSIARSLAKAGYHTEFVYGGDINFTNMNGYLISTGYQRTYGDKDFPADERTTHDWGVTDRLMFGHLQEIISAYPSDRPWHTTFLTLASHEPWVVPYHRFPDNKQANGMAYLDDCIGEFIGKFRKSVHWDNTLIILMPDHGIHYPETMDAADMRRNHIPLIWTGGAVRSAKTIDRICNQTDLAATLLGQMGISHDDFPFSRDVTSATYTYPCALHTSSGTLSFIDSTGVTVVDLISRPERRLIDSPVPSDGRAASAHAFLQTSYDDLGKR